MSAWTEFTTRHRPIWVGVQVSGAVALGAHLTELIAFVHRVLS